MGRSTLKYNQKVYAKITRIYDSGNNEYHFLRNDTRIIFGNSDKLLGAVFMSNPGSFEFKYDSSWEAFKSGNGTNDVFESDLGTPDSTMINIIKAIKEAFHRKGKKIPDGYVRIYNLSSVRCSKGKDALGVHNRVKKLLIEKSGDASLLEDLTVYNKDYFENLCQESNFIIMGYLKEFLTCEYIRLIKWIDECSRDKKIATYFGTNDYPYHPIQWIRLNRGEPFRDNVSTLEKII
jgi:hypothetical protein